MLCSFLFISNRLCLFKLERFNVNAKFGGKFSGLFSADFTLWLCCSFLCRSLFDGFLFLDRFCIGIHFNQLADNWCLYC
jgi:hypothetical protein